MDLAKQKNFYDTRRQFQGKDQPTDQHPEPVVEPLPKMQIIFGLLFLAFIGLLFFLRVQSAREELAQTPPPVSSPAAKPTAK